MRISASKSGVIALSWKRVVCPLWVGEEEDFKDLGSQDNSKKNGAVVMQVLY